MTTQYLYSNYMYIHMAKLKIKLIPKLLLYFKCCGYLNPSKFAWCPCYAHDFFKSKYCYKHICTN